MIAAQNLRDRFGLFRLLRRNFETANEPHDAGDERGN